MPVIPTFGRLLAVRARISARTPSAGCLGAVIVAALVTTAGCEETLRALRDGLSKHGYPLGVPPTRPESRKRLLTRTAIVAASICLLAAGAEGLFAGPGVRARLAALRQPPLSPPFPIWVAIGMGYYVICFTLLHRLLRVDRPRAAHVVALGCLGTLLLVNALWNYFFFRRRDLRASLLLNIPYVLLAVALAITLVGLGDGSIWVFVPYLVYLVYAVYYGYAAWRLNDDAGERRS